MGNDLKFKNRVVAAESPAKRQEITTAIKNYINA
jgi:hypothetical protein